MSNNPAWTVRAISVPGADTELALFISFDDARFLVGAGAGVQRSFVQKRLGMRGMQAIFLPGGGRGQDGLPGVLMTAADAGMNNLTVVGPPDAAHHLATLRASVNRGSLSVDVKPFPLTSTEPSEVVYTHPRLTVRAVALGPPSIPSSSTSTAQRPSQLSGSELGAWHTSIVKDMFRGGKPPSPSPEVFPGLRRPGFADERYPLPLFPDSGKTDMVYIYRAPDVRGKFDPKKAKELGVPNGPIRRNLTMGEAVTFDDPAAEGGKRTVRAEEVLGPSITGSTLIVVHCSKDNLPRLLESTAFAAHQADVGEPAEHAHAVVHCVARDVWETPAYKGWVAAFGPKTHHLYADEMGTEETFFTSASWNATMLSMLDKNVFPVPHHTVKPTALPPLPPNATVLVPNHIVAMHPTKAPEVLPRLEKDKPFPTTVEGLKVALKELAETSTEYADKATAARAAVAAEAERRAGEPSHPGDDIVVTTLGTGSAIPSKYRNATHLDIPGVGGILLDAGEGTLGQLRRRFGPAMPQVHADLRMVCISHMHADHHLGLSAVLADRFKNGVMSKLYLVAPASIGLQLMESSEWQARVPRSALENVLFIPTFRISSPVTPKEDWEALNGIGEIAPEDKAAEESFAEDMAAGVRAWPFVNFSRFHPTTNARIETTIQACLSDLGLTLLQAPKVNHRGAAWGLVLAHSSGWKVVYSGDTMPSPNLIAAGQGATLLIHEATLEDDKPDVAAEKGHSTFAQAIDVGRAMGARYVVLNHFSQRYPKIPQLPSASDEGPVVAISFDFMSVKASECWKLAMFGDALGTLYAEEEEEDVEAVVKALAEGPAGQTPAEGKGKGKEAKVKDAQAREAKAKAKQEKAKQWAPKESGEKGKPEAMKGVETATVAVVESAAMEVETVVAERRSAKRSSEGVDERAVKKMSV